MIVESLGVAAGALIASTKYHMKNTNTYLVAGAIGLGVGLANKSVSKGVGAAATAAWSVIGYSAFGVIDELTTRVETEVKVSYEHNEPFSE